MCSSVKVRWLEQQHAVWALEKGCGLADRGQVDSLFEKMVDTQELIVMPQQLLHLKVCHVLHSFNVSAMYNMKNVMVF